MKVTMSDVLASFFQIGGSGPGDVVPADHILLTFRKIEVEYKEYDAPGKLLGSTKTWFDLKTVKGAWE
jgi:type VI protein secretion system component Hcp